MAHLESHLNSKCGGTATLSVELKMKIKLLKPLYLDSKVVSDGTIIEREELHARELISRGYAKSIESSNAPGISNDVSSNKDDPGTTKKQSTGKKGKS